MENKNIYLCLTQPDLLHLLYCYCGIFKLVCLHVVFCSLIVVPWTEGTNTLHLVFCFELLIPGEIVFRVSLAVIESLLMRYYSVHPLWEIFSHCHLVAAYNVSCKAFKIYEFGQ